MMYVLDLTERIMIDYFLFMYDMEFNWMRILRYKLMSGIGLFCPCPSHNLITALSLDWCFWSHPSMTICFRILFVFKLMAVFFNP